MKTKWYRGGYGTLATPDIRREALREFFLWALPSAVWMDLRERLEAARRDGPLSAGRQRGIIQQWAKAHNLDELWLREEARDHTDAWFAWPKSAGRGMITAPGVTDPLPHSTHERPPQYAPAIETREQYLQRVNEYMALVEIDYGKRGYKRAPENRNPAHLRWLVDYQVNGKSLPTLSREVGGDPEAARNMVWKALTGLAKDLPLSLRPGLRRVRQRSGSRPAGEHPT